VRALAQPLESPHMSRMLGHYRLLRELGRGGMGVVHLAEDTKLGRKVALKVLAPELAENESLMVRFESEARAAAALDHSGIVTLHSLEEADGVRFLTMQFVDGAALTVPEEGLPVEQLVEIATQLASAVGAAHAAGIVHRDLKPANVMLTNDGTVKVCDFGLAKRESVVDASGETAAEVEHRLTASGVLVGTVPYMSPEQVRGKRVDARSDVFSLGVMLYEMATGRRPFRGTSEYDLASAIVRETPEPLASVRPETPEALARVVMRCLEKDREKRFASASELYAALTALGQADRSAEPERPRPWRRSALFVGLVAIVGLHWLFGRTESSPSPAETGERKLELLLSPGHPVFYPALSPDGTTLAYLATIEGQTDLYVRRVAGGDSIRLTDDGAVHGAPLFSPNGDHVAYPRRKRDGQATEVWVIPALGGQARPVVSYARNPSWSPSGDRIAFASPSAEGGTLETVAADGSDRQVLLPVDASLSFVGESSWSPDGETIAVVRGSGGSQATIWIVPVHGGRARRLHAEAASIFSRGPAFTPDGRSIVYASNRAGATNLWMQALEGGEPSRLTQGVGPDWRPTVSSSGALAFVNARWRSALIVHELDTGRSRTLLTHHHSVWGPAFSPSGREIAFSRMEVDGTWNIWIVSSEDGEPRRLTSGPVPSIHPRFAPDGESIVYYTWSSEESDRIWRVPVTGGPAHPMTPEGGPEETYGELSPAEGYLAYSRIAGDDVNVFVLSLADGVERRLTATRSESPRWSPDGDRIAFGGSRWYEGGIFVIGADGTGERRLTESGWWPIWWPDGQRIAFLDRASGGGYDKASAQEIRSVAVDGGPTELVAEIDFSTGNQPFDISPDGEQIVYTNSFPVSSEIWLLQPPESR